MENVLKITREKIQRRLFGIRHEFLARLFPLKKTSDLCIRVNYARQVPGRSEVATGGRVKLIALAEKFPEYSSANILYLVSSALPANFGLWIERAVREGIPIVLNQNGVATPGWAGKKTEEINAPLRHALENASVVLYQSEFCRKSADRFLGPARGPILIAYNSVDLTRFTPCRSSPRPLTILLGGSQYQKYRVTSALETFALVRKSIPDARLLISGKIDWQNDPSRSEREMVELGKQLGVASAVQFLGTFLQSEAPVIYHQADLLLHTKYNDPCPTTVIEALASGLGVIHSRSGGMPELVNSECGVGIPVEASYEKDYLPNPEEWASAVFRAAARLPAMKTAARAEAEKRFGNEQWLGLHRTVFESLISQDKSGMVNPE